MRMWTNRAVWRRFKVDRTAWVYFLEGAGLIKIGWARDVDHRVRTICACSPVKLRLLLVIPGGFEIEQYLHHRFFALCSHGEWFRAEESLIQHISRLRMRHHFDGDDRTYEFGTRCNGWVSVSPVFTKGE